MSSQRDQIEDLQRELILQKRLLKDLTQKLDDATNPPEPPEPEPYVHRRYDPTEGMSMPRSAMRAMIDAVPDALMSDLRGDSRRPNPVTEASSSTLTTAPKAQPVQHTSGGWRDAAPLTSPPGIGHCDRMMDAQDAKDKAELVAKMAKTAAATK